MHQAEGVKGRFVPVSNRDNKMEAKDAYLYGTHPKLPPILAVSKYQPSTWSISHIESGGLILNNFETKKEAEQYVCLCLFFDWDLSGGIPEKTNKGMRLIAKGVRGGIHGGDIKLAAKLHDMLEI